MSVSNEVRGPVDRQGDAPGSGWIGWTRRAVGQESWARSRLFLIAIAAMAALHVGLFFYFGYQARVLRPYSDMFDLIGVYFSFEQTGDWLGYLLTPHSYHRLIWYRLLLALDVGLFKGTGLPFIAAALACAAGIAAVLIRQVRSMPLAVLKLPGLAFVLMLLLSTGNVVVLSVPANTPYIHALFFAVLGIALSESPAARGRALDWRRTAALACACGAAFSNALGFIVWPVYAFLAWRAGPSERRWLATSLAVGGAFATAYVWDLHRESSSGAISLGDAVKSAEYLLAFLGLPWARGSILAGQLIGAGLLACGLAALPRMGGRDAPPYERFAVGLILFSLAAAALAALGRRDVEEAVIVPGRYTILMAPLKIGLVMLALPWMDRMAKRRPQAIYGLVVAAFALYLCQQAAVGTVVAEAGRHLRRTITAFHDGVRTEEMRQLIFPDFGRAQALSDEMQARGLYRHPFIPVD